MQTSHGEFEVVLSEMNFLAHAYLSFGDADLLTGNMISDFVKGAAQYQYPEKIQTGIRLHRAIDTFTDGHPATKEAMQFFKTPYRLYSGPIVDVVYDHFLASDTAIFPNNTLLPFSQEVYAMLEENAAHLPPNFVRMFAYMKADNWLWNYRSRAGLASSLRGLMRRATYIRETDSAMDIFEKNFLALQGCYHAFIEDVKTLAKQQIDKRER